MTARLNNPRRRPSRRGFTLAELLVVVGIIGVLIAILIPTVGAVRDAAYGATTSARIQQLDAAATQYQVDYGAYPGPLTNYQVGRPASGVVDTFLVGPGAAPADPPAEVTSGDLTTQALISGAENLVLGLLGGLVNDEGEIVYDYRAVGQGPKSLNAANPGTSEAYIGTEHTTLETGGEFADEGFENEARLSPGRALDTPIPEFIDAFPDPLPILYYRANPGAPGVLTDVSSGSVGAELQFQYHTADNEPYTNASIGVGRAQDKHGLGDAQIGPAGPNAGEGLVWYEVRYFTDAGLSRDANGDDVLDPDDGDILVPQRKDTFILISAGKDRVYGTGDDLTNFGPIE